MDYIRKDVMLGEEIMEIGMLQIGIIAYLIKK